MFKVLLDLFSQTFLEDRIVKLIRDVDVNEHLSID